MNREQTKYLAVFFNNLSIAVVIVGVITPILTNQKLERTVISGIVISITSAIMFLGFGYAILRKVKNE